MWQAARRRRLFMADAPTSRAAEEIRLDVDDPTHTGSAMNHLLCRDESVYAYWWNKILKADLLILDDFGLYSLTPQAAQDLYEIISERYERASIIITSNRAFEEWAEVFGNDLLASAALDRLTHHTHTLTIRGSSYRQRQRRKEELNSSPTLPAESES